MKYRFIFILLFFVANQCYTQNRWVISSLDTTIKGKTIPEFIALFKDTHQILTEDVYFINRNEKKCDYGYFPAFTGEVRIVQDSINSFSFYESYIMDTLSYKGDTLMVPLVEVLKYKVTFNNDEIKAIFDSCVYKDLYKEKLNTKELIKKYNSLKNDSNYTSKNWDNIPKGSFRKLFILARDMTVMALRGDKECLDILENYRRVFSIMNCGLGSECFTHLEWIARRLRNGTVTCIP